MNRFPRLSMINSKLSASSISPIESVRTPGPTSAQDSAQRISSHQGFGREQGLNDVVLGIATPIRTHINSRSFQNVVHPSPHTERPDFLYGLFLTKILLPLVLRLLPLHRW